MSSRDRGNIPSFVHFTDMCTPCIHTDGQSGIAEPQIDQNVDARDKPFVPSSNENNPILEPVSCHGPTEPAQLYAPFVPIGSTEVKSVTTTAPVTPAPITTGKSRLSSLCLRYECLVIQFALLHHP